MLTREVLLSKLAEIDQALNGLEEQKRALAPKAAAGDPAALTEFKRCRALQRALEDDAEPLSLALQQTPAGPTASEGETR